MLWQQHGSWWLGGSESHDGATYTYRLQQSHEGPASDLELRPGVVPNEDNHCVWVVHRSGNALAPAPTVKIKVSPNT